jgi:hypothetical protein
MTDRPGGPVDPDSPVLAPREEQALEDAVRPVAARGNGASVAAALIVLAFVVGLVRPWDFVGKGAPPGRPGGSGPIAAATSGPGAIPDPGDQGPVPAGTARPPTCGYPMGWRSATLQRWGGERARVWSAVDVVERATGPGDPSIPSNVVAGADFTALGWCAPVAGDERPPAVVQGRLFGYGGDGTIAELPYRRLEPPAASALGELWVPVVAAPGASGAGPAWPAGRYVIELASPDGTWTRWLGIELRAVPTATDLVSARPSSGPSSPSASPAPSPSGAG